MIDSRQLMICVVCGMVLVLAGGVPGVFENLVRGTRNAIAALSGRLPVSSGAEERIGQPVWLAGVGAALSVGGVLAYLS